MNSGQVRQEYGMALAKDRFKFSAAHMTVFESEGWAEALHGHNYRVRVWLYGPETRGGFLVDPTPIKRCLDEICASLDEKTLLPRDCKALMIEADDSQVTARLYGKVYTLPATDVELLPLINVTMEELCRYFAETLIERLNYTGPESPVDRLLVEIAENVGQATSVECMGLRATQKIERSFI